jgi:predicted amidohydrolase
MDDHRLTVRNNHIGIAAHHAAVVARSNVVGYRVEDDRYGYGDSAIFGPNGQPIAEAGLFAEKLITADVAPFLGKQAWRDRGDLRPAIINEMCATALRVLGNK